MFGNRIAIEPALLARLAEIAAARGYASTQEFVTDLLEREVSRSEAASDANDLKQRLRGLGYLE